MGHIAMGRFFEKPAGRVNEGEEEQEDVGQEYPAMVTGGTSGLGLQRTIFLSSIL